ncbi:YqaJ viral recombinase family protein [Pseudomonas sp. 11/12A]|uniref:YqaJ viral recombinase family protein n=1 Tax=Pseudomonas sp. 11/12A TaxID=1506582 RepID=UPI000AE87FA0|nr:YqaJ viral recombinase family protein [Pseudomonas sp. 11/12A]
MDYAFRLAVERIGGKPLDNGFETWQMRREHELEPEARMEHEIQTGLMVTQVGLVKTDDGVFGASADVFIGEDGGAEYKCFLAPEKLRSFHIDNDASEIMDQVQGCMWITGRKWWHIGMYCPDLKVVGRQLWWKEFQRDDDYIEKLEEDLCQFKLLVDGYEAKLRSKAA